MLEQYQNLLNRNQTQVDHLLELGIFRGGSVALWSELLNPSKLIAIDYRKPYESAYLDRYVARAESKITMHWEFDQTDKPRLLDLVKNELDGKLDMVIDDASHMFNQTVASFEVLFPLLRPGGVYVIEDWAWNHWPAYQDIPWTRGQRSPSEVIFRLMESTGGSTAGIEHVEACRMFFALFRDKTPLPEDFSLGKSILRRPHPVYSFED